MHVHNYKPTLFINCLLTSPWAEGGGDNILDFFLLIHFCFLREWKFIEILCITTAVVWCFLFSLSLFFKCLY